MDLTHGRCPHCGEPFDDHKLPGAPVPGFGTPTKPICIPQRKR